MQERPFERSFNKEIVRELDDFLKEQENRFPENEILTMDLHVHDHNSNVPDEIMGRILRVPETYLPTDDLLSTLKKHGCDALTITNHNNARSCYDLQDRGEDVLTAAEFSCMVPDYHTGIHVLTYGFTPEQEKVLESLRRDIYRFQEYTHENDIPTIWAHPLYHYRKKGLPPMEFFEKLVLLFERFEVINGQRDTWQNMLLKKWMDRITPEKIDSFAKKYSIPAHRFCRDPWRKSLSGGSDSHMGIFAGLTGTRLHVPELKKRLKDTSRASLALEAIKRGDMAPYGSHADHEKMIITILDYFCQIGLNMEDPGLLRMLLHKGEPGQKLTAFLIANGFMELKKHRLTTSFLRVFHECLAGKEPGLVKRLMVSRTYKNVFREAGAIAAARNGNPEKMPAAFEESVRRIYTSLMDILMSRLTGKMEDLNDKNAFRSMKDINGIVEAFELPANMRNYFQPPKKGRLKKNRHMSAPDLSGFMNGLSFPALSSSVILGSYLTSAHVMYNSRPLLSRFAVEIGSFRHPERMLWLTDTLEDSNGVAMVLKSMLEEIKKRDLPIDLLVCSSTLESGDHLIVVPPLSEFTLPFYPQQPMRIPNVLEIHNIFKKGEYDRLMCSTEGPMGLISLYLKYAYTVPAYFYVHTDWMMFALKVLNFNQQNTDRLRRLLRAYYRGFDGLFVLNREQRRWLTGSSMGFDESKVFLTAHWAEADFIPRKSNKMEIFGVDEKTPVLLFAGRVSDEKGVMELPAIYEKISGLYPDARIAIAGTGPAEKKLRKALPGGIFLGWVEHDRLPEVYSAADMLLLPSRFDTFGCVVLEALSCGCPVAAYNTKGPRDIIEHGRSGYLVTNRHEMASCVKEYLGDAALRRRFRKAALKRAAKYDPGAITDRLLKDIELKATA